MRRVQMTKVQLNSFLNENLFVNKNVLGCFCWIFFYFVKLNRNQLSYFPIKKLNLNQVILRILKFYNLSTIFEDLHM